MSKRRTPRTLHTPPSASHAFFVILVGGCKPADVEFIDGELPQMECQEAGEGSVCVPSTPLSLLAASVRSGEPASVAVLTGSGFLAFLDSSDDRVLQSFVSPLGEYSAYHGDRLLSCALAQGGRSIVFDGGLTETRVFTPQPDRTWNAHDVQVRSFSPQCVRFDDDAADDLVGLWSLDDVVRIHLGADDFQTSLDLPIEPALDDIGGFPLVSAAGDLDGDGRPEFIVSSEETAALHFFHDLATAQAPLSVWDTGLVHLAAVEVTESPTPRILVVGSEATDESTGTLIDFSIDPDNWQPLADTSHTTVQSPNRLLLVDLDHDSIEDIVVASMPGNAIWIHRVNADGSLEAGEIVTLDHTSIDVEFADLDGDDEVDLITLPLGQDRVLVAWGDGQGGFAR